MFHSKRFKSTRRVRTEPLAASLVFMALAASGLIACSEQGASSPDASGPIEARQRPEAEPNDPEYGKQWHLPKIGAPAAWETTSGDPSVIVAVLDNGFDLTHPDLVDAIWTNPNDAPDGVDNDKNGLVDDVHGWNFADNNANLKDTDGHGTHVAGLIGAVKNNGISVAGVASGVTILPISVGDYAPATIVAPAIRYAVAHGAKIINMSFGLPDAYVGIREAIDYAVAHDVLLVASAHNKSEDGYNYPAVYQDVLAVAATDPADKRAGFSNYGSWVDISAPGQAIVSTFTGGETLAVNGTSQASPIVAGVAALVKSAHPDWTAEQIRTQLLATADDLHALNPDYVGLLGAGRVNAARAVGPAVTDSLPYLAGFTSAELPPELPAVGDQRLNAGEAASISVAWRFRGSVAAATARLVSRDPYVTVTSDAVMLAAPRADRTHTARFTLSIGASTPPDHVAELRASVESAGRTVEETIRVPVAPAYQKFRLPFAYGQTLLPHLNGGQFFVADDSPWRGTPHRVYGAFRKPDGSFTAEKTLSDTATNARQPAAHVDPNGDVHVVYCQALNREENAAVPGYSKYTAATGEWSTTALIGDNGIWARLDRDDGLAHSPQPVAISRSPEGELHLAWSFQNVLVLTKQGESDGSNGPKWGAQQVVPFPFETDDVAYNLLDLAFMTVGERLKLFVHPVPTRASQGGPPPNYKHKLQVLEYDGKNWSAPIELDAGTEAENAQMPALLDGTVNRFQAPLGGGGVVLAELAGQSWKPIRDVLDLGGVELESGFFGLKTSSGAVAFLVRPVPATLGSTRELWQDGVVTPLIDDTKYRARYPVIQELSGTRFIFNQEFRIYREPAHGATPEKIYTLPHHTNFYSSKPVDPKVLPTLPLVTDDGETTTDNRQLHARWSSSHSAGIKEYRVAWGTAPGLDDIVPWSITTDVEDSFDLGEQRLLPGQTVYLSVEARSNAILSSAMGVSDGITMASP